MYTTNECKPLDYKSSDIPLYVLFWRSFSRMNSLTYLAYGRNPLALSVNSLNSILSASLAFRTLCVFAIARGSSVPSQILVNHFFCDLMVFFRLNNDLAIKILYRVYVIYLVLNIFTCICAVYWLRYRCVHWRRLQIGIAYNKTSGTRVLNCIPIVIISQKYRCLY